MLSNIIVASDGSEASDRMIECARDLARVGSKRATLVHVFNVLNVGGPSPSLKEFMLPRLDKQAGILRDAGLEVDVQTPLGIPSYEINRIARERRADLVAVGSLGASLVGDVLLGSTAHSVLQNAQFPTLLFRIEITHEDGGKRCQVACQNLFQQSHLQNSRAPAWIFQDADFFLLGLADDAGQLRLGDIWMRPP